MTDEVIGMARALTFPLVQVYAQHRLPRALVDRAKVEVAVDLASRDLVISLASYLAGQEGDAATATRTVDAPKFPRLLPKWVRRRWTGTQTVSVTARPLLVWPEAQWSPDDWGSPVRIIRQEWP